MKNTLFLLLIIPFMAFGQSSITPETETPDALKKSAESFVTSWFKCFEEKKLDNLTGFFSDDAQLYTSAKTVLLKDEAKSLTDYYKNKVTDCKATINSFSTEVFGQNAALVTVRYLEMDEVQGNREYFDYLDNYLLEKQNGNWKIKRIISSYSQPVIFGNSVENSWQRGKAEPFNRFNGALGQMNGITAYFLGDYKKNGTPLPELGKIVGARFAKSWDESRGFKGLSSGFVWVVQSISPYIEILERSETNVKVKYENIFRNLEKDWNITDQEILDYFRNAFSAIADHMGGTCTIDEDGKYYLLTLNEK